ncbi:alkaline phosphatase family protein, partial [Dysgonomonas sp. OttesenSCG-928-M03]|nr:alkaline phosphatase family protein [Dysgonomonas sp. OttesenSCG-928-M03]
MIRIITSLVAVLTVASIQSQTTLKETPKLVIGITIDQLRGDYLELFQRTFSERGFKRLLNEGLVYQNMAFDFPNVNEASSIATIYTGTSPFYHGIVGSKIYLSDKNTEASIFEDNNYLGNYTREKLSPVALRVGTMTDELKMASQGRSDIFALTPHSYQALASAGHLANGAYWIEDYSGKWATSAYYKDMYWAVEQENRTNVFSNQPAAIVWQPILPNDKYNAFPYAAPATPFNYQFGQASNPYPLLKESPFVNENITQTALKLMQKDDMGKRTSPDFLAVTYYAGNYSASVSGDYSYAVQDTYVRLDKEIATLLDQVEKTVGLQNTFIFVTSTGYYDSSSQYPDNVKIKPGTFYPKRC